jgi:methylphosphotriester-DNA--protein-cysteine methyltransferase
MFVSTAPRGALGQLVESIWLHRGATPAHGVDLRLPTGKVEVMLDLDEHRSMRSVVAGPFQRPYPLETAQQSHVVGVVCRPSAARALLGVPARELADRHVALEDLWGAAAGELRERVLAATAAEARLREVENVLEARLAHTDQVSHPLAAAATGLVARAPAALGVAELGEHLGWSVRRLQQVFRDDVGLTPKAYQRLQRFRGALVGIEAAERVGWPAFALQRGYADQSHLIREFRAHAGVTPSQYLLRRGAHLNHVPLAG